MGDVEIRELETEREWLDAFPVMVQLRTHLDEEQYLDHLHRMTATGYRLFGLFAGGELAAVAGAGVSTNMYDGRHLWVFDLVTDADRRSEGHGRRLVRHLVDRAEGMGCERVALASGLWREDAHRFYEDQLGMDRTSYVFTLDLD